MVQLVARPPIHLPSFSKWDPQRKDELFLYNDKPYNAKNTSPQDAHADRENYRYKLTIIDHPSLSVQQMRPIPLRKTTKNGRNVHSNKETTNVTNTTQTFMYTNAIFLIPAGRETEYIFSSMSGLRSILKSANTARLIAVAFGRNYSSTNDEDIVSSSTSGSQNDTSLQTVQDELRYVVQMIASAIPSETISKCLTMKANASPTFYPYLALNGVGQRNIIDKGNTTCSGRYIIEQCAISESDDDPQWVRRLYFLDGNPNVIQSEVNLLKKSNSIDNNTDAGWIVDKSATSFEYHKSLTAGLLAFLPPLNSTSSPLQSYSGLLIGLGGGGLVNFWHCIHGEQFNESNHSKWGVTAIELDATMVQIASKHFGLAIDHPSFNIRIGNGLDIFCIDDDTTLGPTLLKLEGTTIDNSEPDIASSKRQEYDLNSNDLGFRQETLDYIVIDVDSKETGAGMSCPPASFVEISYLQTLFKLLRPDHGILAINVAARDANLFHKTCQAVQAVFPTVFLSKRYRNQDERQTPDDKNYVDNEPDIEPEDLNVVLFATRQSFLNEENHGSSALLSLSEMTDRIRRWIVPHDDHDSKNNDFSSLETRAILKSELSECCDDFIVYDSMNVSTANSTLNISHTPSSSSNNKRRNNRRNKKRK